MLRRQRANQIVLRSWQTQPYEERPKYTGLTPRSVAGFFYPSGEVIMANKLLSRSSSW